MVSLPARPHTAEGRMLRPASAPVPQAALLHVFAVADDTWNGTGKYPIKIEMPLS